MKALDNITMSQIVEYIAEKQAEERGISKALAKKLVINAMSYNVVVSAIEEQIEYLLED